jgi:hypothetical protein
MMGFLFYIYYMEIFNSICQNPWCKGQYSYTENDFVKTEDGLEPPKQCKKCKSFATELSGGVEWKDKTYEGDRWDNNRPHQITYKVTNYK